MQWTSLHGRTGVGVLMVLTLVLPTHLQGVAEGKVHRSRLPEDVLDLPDTAGHSHKVDVKFSGHHTLSPKLLRRRSNDEAARQQQHHQHHQHQNHHHHRENHLHHSLNHHSNHHNQHPQSQQLKQPKQHQEHHHHQQKPHHQHHQHQQKHLQQHHHPVSYPDSRRFRGRLSVERGFAFRADEENGGRVGVYPVGSPDEGGAANPPMDAAAIGPPPGPSFDKTLPRNVTIQAGKMAILSCRVFNINDKSVSWIRLDDLHILTVDKYKYSTDQRVSVVFNEPNLEWVLRIRSVTPADQGRYECQVSTKPVLSYIVNMRVVVPRAWILNAPEIYVHRGSPINLTCVITHGTERPVFVYWYHENKVIDYDGRGGVSVSTQTTKDTVSYLLVEEAGLSDSGRYTCSPSNGEDASVRLHVLNGEYQAAMQTNRGSTSTFPWRLHLLLTAIHMVYSLFHLLDGRNS
ncbi:hemicentin-2-like isoform X2 [Penaeus chinensis]|uniref:hemicentin-2-like isoform X2 n=1 Tax=Penaeus chinensis TaxID=139456 RepID=UPI001FB6256F|nr:hemicentin-2-like isoform X2 [Penaeus chinensis]